jgi:hypothetical protein
VHEVAYVHLTPEGLLPVWTGRRPFNAVVVATCAVSADWQDQVSDWLVKSGCLYMLAWGVNCSVWDDTVDWATRKLYGPEDIPDEAFVITTWHTNETLEGVFWEAQFNGTWGYNDQMLDFTLIIDITGDDRRAELIDLFRQSRDLSEREAR